MVFPSSNRRNADVAVQDLSRALVQRRAPGIVGVGKTENQRFGSCCGLQYTRRDPFKRYGLAGLQCDGVPFLAVCNGFFLRVGDGGSSAFFPAVNFESVLSR